MDEKPSNTEVSFEPELKLYKFSSKILAVAKQGGAGFDWSAYIFVVPGINHEKEMHLWKTEGDKLEYRIAKVLFPSFDKRFQWRR